MTQKETIISALINALCNEKDSMVRRTQVQSLGEIGDGNIKVILTLRDVLLQDKDPGVRKLAVEALGKVGSKSQDAVDALIIALNDKDPNVRISAAQASVKIAKYQTPTDLTNINEKSLQLLLQLPYN